MLRIFPSSKQAAFTTVVFLSVKGPLYTDELDDGVFPVNVYLNVPGQDIFREIFSTLL